ncbi:TLD-domain-containing protein [Chaetomium sp. MPI-CAGE-AT-0009]|nr:TLD-domain-containing protein [Chaetomium sp. MPI-CAGE-AT-0009]
MAFDAPNHNQPPRTRHTPNLNLSPTSSRSVTPPGTASPSSTRLTSSVSSLWGGFMRRFSTEPSPSTPHPAGLPHARTFQPDGGDKHHHHEDHHGNGVDGVYTPPHLLHPHRTASPMRLPPLEPLQLLGFSEETPQDARLLTAPVAEEIRIMVPARLGIVDEWRLVYSLEQDGASLATLYEKCAQYQGVRVGFVLCVKDCDGGLFGAYLSDYPHPAPKYFGTGECFLWRASAFPYSGINEYYMLCEAHFLSLGAGDGKYGLWLDDSLERGVSSTSQTFGNEPLSDEGEKFGVLGIEVWVIGA